MSQTETTTSPLHRVRLTFSRQDALRYVSHLDMLMVWERTLRRAKLPLAYSKGFNPKPKLHQASALPLGFLSRCEITDFWLDMPDEPDVEAVAAQVQAAAPPGLTVLECQIVPLTLPALQTQVIAATYRAIPLDEVDFQTLEQGVEQLLAVPEIPRERRGKSYDLRPLVEDLQVGPGENGRPVLVMRLTAREGATGRPEEVLSVLGQDPTAFRVERTKLILS
jgi:radical SAM-linked protein